MYDTTNLAPRCRKVGAVYRIEGVQYRAQPLQPLGMAGAGVVGDANGMRIEDRDHGRTPAIP